MLFFEEVSVSKKVIFVAVIIQVYLTAEVELEHFNHFVVNLVSSLKEEVLVNDLVFR